MTKTGFLGLHEYPELAKQSYDLEMEVDGFEDYESDAFIYKSDYDH